MINFFNNKPMTQAEAIFKLSQKMPIKEYTSQILALSELEEKSDGHRLNILA